ncbi:unnamed protein product [Lasius platythorax]|uniref:Uncharacterized protein n=1 Tax=Lasius platythorax TaxID=488582 RepID=A0AAV2NA58_9HYME
MFGRMENGKTTKQGGQLLQTNGSPSSLASVNEGPLLCPLNYFRRPILANLIRPVPLSSSIRAITCFYHRDDLLPFTFAQIKKEFLVRLDGDCCNNESLNESSQIYHM